MDASELKNSEKITSPLCKLRHNDFASLKTGQRESLINLNDERGFKEADEAGDYKV